MCKCKLFLYSNRCAGNLYSYLKARKSLNVVQHDYLSLQIG